MDCETLRRREKAGGGSQRQRRSRPIAPIVKAARTVLASTVCSEARQVAVRRTARRGVEQTDTANGFELFCCPLLR